MSDSLAVECKDSLESNGLINRKTLLFLCKLTSFTKFSLLKREIVGLFRSIFQGEATPLAFE